MLSAELEWSLVPSPFPGDICDFWTRSLYISISERNFALKLDKYFLFFLHTHTIRVEEKFKISLSSCFPPSLTYTLILITLHTISIAQKQGSHSNSQVQYSVFQTYSEMCLVIPIQSARFVGLF
uniref:Uncharacterized protein n=1 Tax=Micrurus corallinus TaxID=54390 RepID=A0A2D4FJ64_MICCO